MPETNGENTHYTGGISRHHIHTFTPITRRGALGSLINACKKERGRKKRKIEREREKKKKGKGEGGRPGQREENKMQRPTSAACAATDLPPPGVAVLAAHAEKRRREPRPTEY